MKRVLAGIFVLCAGHLLVSCGDGGDSPAPLPYMVNAATGNDAAGDGVTTPYRTITKALSTAGLGDTVTVAPGTYDSALGESFPIVIPPGVTLIGDEMNKGNGPTPTLIRGGGGYGRLGMVVVAGDYATIAGFTITNNNPFDIVPGTGAWVGHGVVMDHRIVVTLRNNRIAGCRDYAVYGLGGDRSVISGNEIVNNGGALSFGGGGEDFIRIDNNIIRANSAGVRCYAPTYADLGGGPAHSVGGNVIAGNAAFDLWTDVSTFSYARNNFWDHVPPTVGTGATGFDIVNVNVATIHIEGAALAP